MKPEAIIARLIKLRESLEKFPVDPKTFDAWKRVYSELWELQDRLKWCIQVKRKTALTPVRFQMEFAFASSIHYCPEFSREKIDSKWRRAA